MSGYFFNERSFDAHIDTPESFTAGLQELVDFSRITRSFKKTPHLHRPALYERIIMGRPFRDAVNKLCIPEQKRQILSSIDRSMHTLPENETRPSGLIATLNEDFECNESALAECAYRLLMAEDACSYSLSLSDYFNTSPLDLCLAEADEIYTVPVENLFSLRQLEDHCKAHLPELNSWDELLDRAEAVPRIIINKGVREHLNARETFDHSVAETILVRLESLREMSEAPTHDAFIVAEKKYCHGKGKKSWVHFSDSSDTEKNKFEDRMTFKVNGTDVKCFFHGKIARKCFRIHMVGRPTRGQDNVIVYIGYKLTI